jgi:hypothetical protein
MLLRVGAVAIRPRATHLWGRMLHSVLVEPSPFPSRTSLRRAPPAPGIRQGSQAPMHWIAPAEQNARNQVLETRLWNAADQLRANSGLTSAQYSQPVLGLIFLRFAEVRFLARRAVLEKHAGGGRRGSRVDDPARIRQRASSI